MQSTPKPIEPESFLNGLLRSYYITQISSIFDSKSKIPTSFSQKDKSKYILELKDLKLKPSFLYDHFLPLELKFNHIESLSIEVNDHAFFDSKITLRGVFLSLNLSDLKLDIVQERLRWIGLMFEDVGTQYNETGNNNLKTKLRIAFQQRFLKKLTISVQDVVIHIDTPKGLSFGLAFRSVDFETDEVKTINLKSKTHDVLCKKVEILGLAVFAFKSEQLCLDGMKEADAKKVFITILKKMTTTDLFTSDILKKFVPGAVNLPCSGKLDIQFKRRRDDIMFSEIEVDAKLENFNLNITTEYFKLVLDYIGVITAPFEIFGKIEKLKHKMIEFNDEMHEKAQAIGNMFQAFTGLREKMKLAYLASKVKKTSEIIRIEDFADIFPFKEGLSEFKTILLNMEMETLYVAVKNAYLLSSRVNTIDEKNLSTIFISKSLPANPEAKKNFYELIRKFYVDIIPTADIYNKEQTQIENYSLDFRFQVEKINLFFASELEMSSSGQKIGQISLRDLRYYHIVENGLRLQFKSMLESITLDTKVGLLPYLGLARGKFGDSFTLKNTLTGEIKGISIEYKHSESKAMTDYTLCATIEGPITINEKVYSENNTQVNLIESIPYTINPDVGDSEESAQFQMLINVTRGEETLLISEVLANLTRMKINDPGKMYSYFGGPIDRLPKHKDFNVEFDKNLKFEITSEQVYSKILRKKPYYQVFGTFELYNAGLDDQKNSKLEGALLDQQILIDMGDCFDQISGPFEGLIDVVISEGEVSIKTSVANLKLVITSKNLMHLLSDSSFLLEKSITSDNVISESIYEKITIVWFPTFDLLVPGVSCLIIRFSNLYTQYTKKEANPNWNLSLEGLTADIIEYVDSSSCISRRILGTPVEPLILPNTDFMLLSKLTMNQSSMLHRQSSSIVIDKYRHKFLVINLENDENSNLTFSMMINEPKLLFTFSIFERLQETHQLFQVYEYITRDLDKLRFGWSEKITVNDFILYLPANTYIEDEMMKTLAITGSVTYATSVKSFGNTKSGQEISREGVITLQDLQMFISTIAEIKNFNAKKENCSRRMILFPFSFDAPILITRLQSFQDNEYNIRDTFSILLSDLSLDCQITISDLMLIYETLSEEYASFTKLSSQDRRLNTSTIMSMSTSNFYKAPTYAYERTILNINLKSFGLQMCLLNDVEGYCFPELESKLNITELSLNDYSLFAEGKFKLYFFSLVSKHWEPIIQTFSFYLGSTKKNEATINFFNTNAYDNKDVNVTITEDFLEFLTKTYIYLDSRTSSLKKSSIMSSTKSMISSGLIKKQLSSYSTSPYILKNFSGFDLEISVGEAKKLVPDGESEKVSKPSLMEKSILVDAENFQIFIKTKSVKSLSYEYIGSVNLDHFGVQKVPIPFLKYSQKYGNPFLIVQTERRGFHIVNTIFSPVLFENHLSTSLDIRISNAKDSSKALKQARLPTKGVLGVSLEIIEADMLEITTENGWKIKGNLQDLIVMKNHEIKVLNVNTKVFVLRKMQNSSYPGMSISIEIGVTIKNVLPLPITILITTKANKTIEKKIEANFELVLDDIEDIHDSALVFKLPGSELSKDSLKISDFHKMLADEQNSTFSNKLNKGIILYDKNKYPYQIVFSCLKHNPNKFYIHTSSIIIDKSQTGKFQIVQEVTQENKALHFPLLVSQISQLRQSSRNTYPTFIFNAANPFLLVSDPNHKDLVEKILITPENPSKETKIEIKDGDQVIAIPLTILMESNCLENDAHIDTTIYTIYPSFSFSNKTESVLVVITSSNTRLVNPNEVIPLDWLKDTEFSKISLKQIFNGAEMSVGTTELNLLDIDSINIAFRNKRGEICGIINFSTIKSRGRIQVIASKEVKEYLYSIENQIPGVDLIVCQRESPSAFQLVVKSGARIPFAWDYPLRPKELVVRPANPKVAIGNSEFNFSQSMSTSLTLEDGKSINIQSVVDFVAYANAQLTFAVVDHGKLVKKKTNLGEIGVSHGTNSMKIEVGGNDLGLERSYYQVPRVVISIVWQNKRRREEIYRLYVDHIQISKQKLRNSGLWNVYIEDMMLFKNLSKQFALDRFDKPDQPLKLSIIFSLINENAQKANRMVELLVIKSDSIPRLKLIATELDQYFKSLLKKVEDRTVYEKKNFTNLAQSLMSLSNKIAIKKKIIFSTVYLLQSTKKINPTDKKALYSTIKMFNIRVSSDDAVRYLIQQISDLGTAFASHNEKAIKKFIDSRAFYVVQLEPISTFGILYKDKEYKNIGGFEQTDIEHLNTSIIQIQKVLRLEIFKSKAIFKDPTPKNDVMSKSSGLLSKILSISKKFLLNLDKKPKETQEIPLVYTYSAQGVQKANKAIKFDFMLQDTCCLRVSYGKEKAIHSLNEQDGAALRACQMILNLPYEEIASLDFMDHFGYVHQGGNFLLIFTIQYIFCLNCSTRKLSNYLKVANIRDIKLDSNGLVIISFEGGKDKVSTFPRFPFDGNEEMMKRLKRVIKKYQDSISH